jgi:hypothetical protein
MLQKQNWTWSVCYKLTLPLARRTNKAEKIERKQDLCPIHQITILTVCPTGLSLMSLIVKCLVSSLNILYGYSTFSFTSNFVDLVVDKL